MSAKDVIRAWKDEDFRLGLSAAQRAMLPDNPVGAIELSDEDLTDVAGAKPSIDYRPCTAHGCNTPIILCRWP